MEKNQVNELTLTNCLIVDDDKFSRTFIKSALSQIGIKNVKEAASAKEGIEILKEYGIDLVILDQVMPDQDGIEFVQEVKKLPNKSLKDLIIIMVTVDTQEKTVLKAKELGIKEYLVKPISPNALKSRIEDALNLKKE